MIMVWIVLKRLKLVVGYKFCIVKWIKCYDNHLVVGHTLHLPKLLQKLYTLISEPTVCHCAEIPVFDRRPKCCHMTECLLLYSNFIERCKNAI